MFGLQSAVNSTGAGRAGEHQRPRVLFLLSFFFFFPLHLPFSQVYARKLGGWKVSHKSLDLVAAQRRERRGEQMLIIKGLWYNNSRGAPLESGESTLLIFMPDEPLCIRWRWAGGRCQDAACVSVCMKVRLISATLCLEVCPRSGWQKKPLLLVHPCSVGDTQACFHSAALQSYRCDGIVSGLGSCCSRHPSQSPL